MFVHPMCPCSGASVEELSRLMARTDDALDVKVVAIAPKDAPRDWEDSTLVKSIRNIPGVEVVYDRSGEEAGRFGAMTSGHAALYDRSGTLMFSGGITASRGHAGANAGADAIVALVRNQADAAKHTRTQTPVYGCLLPGQPESDKQGQQRAEQGHD
jgi:hypothetical protein